MVHHILADPVYAGTAYANRYDYVAAKKPRSRSAHGGERHCRRLKPQEQWIAIPAPALVDQAIWDQAQLQLARNATLSFRNNSKHNYLLRCLLSCQTCGLAMHGCCVKAASGQPDRRYYQCAGKNFIFTARPAPCPRARIRAEVLERVVWDHIAALLSVIRPSSWPSSSTSPPRRVRTRPAPRRTNANCKPGWSTSRAPTGACSMPIRPRSSAYRN